MPTARFRAINPDDIEFAFSMTMDLKGWKGLSKKIKIDQGHGNLPACEVVNAIHDMAMQAEEVFVPRKDVEQ